MWKKGVALELELSVIVFQCLAEWHLVIGISKLHWYSEIAWLSANWYPPQKSGIMWQIVNTQNWKKFMKCSCQKSLASGSSSNKTQQTSGFPPHYWHLSSTHNHSHAHLWSSRLALQSPLFCQAFVSQKGKSDNLPKSIWRNAWSKSSWQS